MSSLKVLWIALAVVGGLVFFWLVVLKVLVRLNQGRGAPCPASLAWLVNNPIRRHYVPLILDQVGIQPGERVLELGLDPPILQPMMWSARRNAAL